MRFRPNRRTLWSLTRGGTALNLHEGYRHADPWLLDHLARVACEPRGTSPEARRSRAAVRDALLKRMEDAAPRPPGPDSATPDQAHWLRALYTHHNRAAFRGDLPADLPLRLSARMRSTLGWIRPEHHGPRRQVGELALNADLVLPENAGLLVEVLRHEMAHVEAWLLHGEGGHGPAWKRIATRVGCTPRARPRGMRLVRRPSGTPPNPRVPPLPEPR
ncbi:MAG: hypothetical protein EA352_02180 [Gemmatimonadales bacterium]|nr:MAG: hypothetical protein EA352_02180 [Gemmatimonadales bacterium]